MNDIQNLKNLIDEMGITIESKFIPFSQSRNKNDKWESLNWKIRISVKGKPILETDYSVGMGYCPSYLAKYSPEKYPGVEAAVKAECETGYAHQYFDKWADKVRPTKKKIEPCIVSVMRKLVADAEAIDCAGFEDWCRNYWFTADLNKARETYEESLKVAIALNDGLEKDEMVELKDAFTCFF
jgi:hypothetical protein